MGDVILKEKLEKLLQDEEFVKELLQQETAEDAQKFFAVHGVEISIDELNAIRKGIMARLDNSEELSDDQLENVAGGGTADVITFAIDTGVKAIIFAGDKVHKWTRGRW